MAKSVKKSNTNAKKSKKNAPKKSVKKPTKKTPVLSTRVRNPKVWQQRTHDEKKMRAQAAPNPKTLQELTRVIDELVDGPHDYGTAVYATSLAATAAFHFVAHTLGLSGFQASVADLDVLRRTRHYEGPFMVIDGSNLLYPQYDLHGNLDEFIQDNAAWVKEQAQKKLDEDHGFGVSPRVWEHWEKLAAMELPKEDK